MRPMPGASGSTLQESSYLPASRRTWMLGGLALLFFIASAVAICLTRRPWWDEGLFGDVAMNFRDSGHFGSRALDTTGFLLFPGVHQYTYWQFPLYFVAVGSWLRLLPGTVVTMRLFSAACGLVYLVCWFLLARRLSRNEPLAIYITSLLAVHWEVLRAASEARMDMMCAALGIAAMAAFFCLKESNSSRAVFVAGCFGAAAMFSHPMGVLINVVLVSLVFWHRNEIRWTGLAAAIAPYILGGALWLAYILEAPHMFAAQVRSQRGVRVGGLLATLANVLNDFTQRYLTAYWFVLNGYVKGKIVLLVFCVIGLLAVAMDRRLRSQALGRVLLLLIIVCYLGVALVDNMKFNMYLIYTLPPMTACGVFWLYSQWRERGRFRIAASVLAGAFAVTSFLGIAARIHQNEWKSTYTPAVNVIRAGLPPGGLLFGGSEFGFAFGFQPWLVDDRWAGFVTNQRPDVFVTNECYRIEIDGEATRKLFKGLQAYLRKNYHVVFQKAPYVIYYLNRNSTAVESR
ncbi:MAG: glycosyltransferase family 39 protein [Acidobacteriaceae bacterium]|nr:glycosyltransferase family 39 protein [Acidobacteriaceae bacterium]